MARPVSLQAKELFVPKLSAQRKITLTLEQCRLAGIEPGDEVDVNLNENLQIILVKKTLEQPLKPRRNGKTS